MVRDTKQYLWDLSWGEPVCVREVLDKHYRQSFKPIDILNMGYAPDDGNEVLVELIQDYLLDTCGKTYEHVIVTTGTVSAINVVLRTFQKYEGTKYVSTYSNHFPWYPHIIEKNGLKHRLHHLRVEDNQMKLIDMPSNVTGNMSQSNFGDKCLWDSVYYNPVYINSPRLSLRPHRVNVGSFSKVLGLTGLRIGYIATDSTTDYKRFQSENLYESGTISQPSQALITDILETMPFDKFYYHAKASVNNNRESLNKINHLFNGQMVQNNGMFYAVQADSKAVSILDKALVKYVVLSEDGSGQFIRFNLGQNNKITADAVKEIEKVDKI